MPEGNSLSLRSDEPLCPAGLRRAHLLLRGGGVRPAGRLRHRAVRLQLADERHLGGRHAGRGLVRDQQVRERHHQA